MLLTGNQVDHLYAYRAFGGKNAAIATSEAVSILGRDLSSDPDADVFAQFTGAGENTYNELLTGDDDRTYIDRTNVITNLVSITSGRNNIAGLYYDRVTKTTTAVGWGQCWGKGGILAGCDDEYASRPVPLGCVRD
ncbi:hypothetical protein GEMRC1_008540 [Eukaryota sp. GEM-RC1]